MEEEEELLLEPINDLLNLLSAEAYSAIENISKQGIEFIPITGRPAGWCDMIARFWPVKGVIGENGAFFFSYDHKNKKMIR